MVFTSDGTSDSESRGFDPDRLDRRDPRFIATLLPLFELFARRYVRLQTHGLENLPAGPALFVANHNGGIMGPDLFCTLSTLWRQLGDQPLYALAHDFAMRKITPLGWLLQRVGAIRACRENADRALASGASVLVYPGGDVDAYRLSRRRDEVVLLPRTGFVDVARRADVPIVPIVAHGAHRSAFIFSEGESIARALKLRQWSRIERFPLALALPWIFAPGPWLPYLPLPFPIRLQILPPRKIGSSVDTAVAASTIQAEMQHALDELAR